MSDFKISRKRLKEAIYTDFIEHFTQYHDSDQTALIEMVMDDIEEIPTAFDREKVIEELRQEAIYGLGIPEEKFYMDEGEYSSYCSISFSQAKRIIEKGGIE